MHINICILFFPDSQAGQGSPLIEELFALNAIKHILVTENTLTITKNQGSDWNELKRPIGQIIRKHMQEDLRNIIQPPTPAPQLNPKNDAEIQEIVHQLLNDEINPSIAQHGGKISLIQVFTL